MTDNGIVEASAMTTFGPIHAAHILASHNLPEVFNVL
jgi:hypothetical protein